MAPSSSDTTSDMVRTMFVSSGTSVLRFAGLKDLTNGGTACAGASDHADAAAASAATTRIGRTLRN